MRILIATSHRNTIGGVETYLQAVIPELLGRGNEVAMLYDYRPVAPGIPVDPPGANLPLWFCEDLRQGPDFWRGLNDWKPDVCYSHGLETLGVDRALLESYPVVAYRHDYRGTCVTGRKSHAFPMLRPCSRTFGPICLALYYPRRCGGLNPFRAWKAFQQEQERNTRLPEYHKLLVASTHMFREFQAHGVSAERLHLLPLPIPHVQPIPPRERLAHRGQILFVGRLTDLKGVHYLIQAIPKASRKLGQTLALTVAGDGSAEQELQQLASRLHVEVDFKGWVDGTQKHDLMLQADLLAVPSVWPEPFGLVGPEAGRFGLPAVGYAVGGIPDWLISGQNGELAPGDPPTVDGLADAMVRALSNVDHYKKLCRGALELSERYSVETHVAELETVLIDAAGACRPHALAVH